MCRRFCCLSHARPEMRLVKKSTVESSLSLRAGGDAVLLVLLSLLWSM